MEEAIQENAVEIVELPEVPEVKRISALRKDLFSKKATQEDLEIIRSQYIQGVVDSGRRTSVTIASLAKSFGFNASVLSRVANEEMWTEQRISWLRSWQEVLLAKRAENLILLGKEADELAIHSGIKGLKLAAEAIDDAKKARDALPETAYGLRSALISEMIPKLARSLVDCQKAIKLAVGESTENLGLRGSFKSATIAEDVASAIAESDKKLLDISLPLLSNGTED